MPPEWLATGPENQGILLRPDRGSTPPPSASFVHVRQIRLAAAVRKTATRSGKGGSNPLTCTKAFCISCIWGGEVPHLACPHEVEIARSNRAPRTATSSKDRTPPCRGVRCEFESRRSRQFRRCTLGWFGGCSFKALIRGFDSRHRRQYQWQLL